MRGLNPRSYHQSKPMKARVLLRFIAGFCGQPSKRRSLKPSGCDHAGNRRKSFRHAAPAHASPSAAEVPTMAPARTLRSLSQKFFIQRGNMLFDISAANLPAPCCGNLAGF